METIELAGKLILAFALFCALGATVTIAMIKIFFKPLNEEELKRWNEEELREWKSVHRTLKPKRNSLEYTIHRKAS